MPASAAALLLLAASLLLAGCGNHDTVLAPEDPPQVVEGEPTLLWMSEERAMGSVMYGEVSGRYTRIAYPLGRQWGRVHTTPLLADAGRIYYAKTRAVLPSGAIVQSREFRFVLAGPPAMRSRISWTMANVGWGDAHLLTGPRGERVLIDAGQAGHAGDLSRFLLARIDPARGPFLDAVLATHEDSDHIGGLVGSPFVDDDGILERFTVGRILFNEAPEETTAELRGVAEIAALKGIPVVHLTEGQTDAETEALRWGDGLGVTVLNARNLTGDGQANNGSVALRIAYGAFRMIAAGDLETAGEERLVSAYGVREGGAFLRADVLKVDHHGYEDASSPAYVEAVAPVVALVPIVAYEVACSAPADAVLRRLFALPADVYRSDFARPVRTVLGRAACEDDYGHVQVLTDGRSFEVRLEPSRIWTEGPSGPRAGKGAASPAARR